MTGYVDKPSGVEGDDSEAKVSAILDPLANACRDLWGAWVGTSAQLGQVPAVDSLASKYAHAFAAKHPDARPTIGWAAGQFAGRYVSGMGAHVLGLAALLSGRELRLSHWAVIRSQLELGGRAAWLIAPDKDGHLPEPDAQIARVLMEALADARRHAKTASAAKLPADVKDAFAGGVTQVEADLTAVFPDWILTGLPEDHVKVEDKWTLAGERHVALAAGVKRFADFAFERVPGLYDRFSVLAHPSWVSLQALAPARDVDGVSVAEYSIEVAEVVKLVRLGCLALFRAAHLVVMYYGLDDTALTSWSNRHSDWFSEDS